MSLISATATSETTSTAAQFLEGLASRARAGVDAYCKVVLAEAQSIVHVDSGDLRDSGSVVPAEGDREITGYVQFTSDHAMFNEFGTGQRGASSAGAGPYSYSPTWPGMAAIPFLRPALDSTRDTGLTALAAEMKLT